MLLTVQQSYELLAKHGCYVTEICDACGNGLGPVRYTRHGETGAWCSCECRDGKDAHAPGTCRGCGISLAGQRKGTKFCSDVCRVRFSREVPNHRKFGEHAAHSKGLKNAGIGFGCPYTKRAEIGRAEGARR